MVKRFPVPLRSLLARVTNGLAALMMVVVVWTSIIVALATWSERLGAINLTSSVFFLPVILGALHATLHLTQMALFPSEPTTTEPRT